jgi:hypothetical protein
MGAGDRVQVHVGHHQCELVRLRAVHATTLVGQRVEHVDRGQVRHLQRDARGAAHGTTMPPATDSSGTVAGPGFGLWIREVVALQAARLASRGLETTVRSARR